MILLKKKFLPFIDRKIVWFGVKPQPMDFLTTVYKQCQLKQNVFGFKRDDFYTKLIDLTEDENVINYKFNKDTLYEIRRAKKDGLIANIETEVTKFIIFYNAFAKTKQLNTLDNSILYYGDSLAITKASLDEETLVMHSYLLDRINKRVRLLHSASLYRNENVGDNKRAIVGRANRFLHADDMQRFKLMGFELYDMGGYAYGTLDKSLQRINDFKDGFGGKLVLESDYWPHTLVFALNVISLGKKVKRKMFL